MIQYSKLGIMQGRFSPPFNNNIQHFPVNYWQNEFHILKEFGLGCIEWVYEFPNIKQNPLHFSNQCEEIKHIALQTGIRVNTVVADYFMDNLLTENDPIKQNKNLKVLKNLIKHCSLASIPIVEIPFVDSSSIQKAHFPDIVKILAPIVDYANELNIKISLETDLEPARFKMLIEMFLPRKVFVNYDMGNSASLDFDPVEEIDLLGKYIINVHIKDRVIGGTTVPLGDGDVNFENVFSTLKKIDYSHDFIIQAARQDIGNQSLIKSPQNTIIEYLDFLKPWIARS